MIQCGEEKCVQTVFTPGCINGSLTIKPSLATDTRLLWMVSPETVVRSYEES